MDVPYLLIIYYVVFLHTDHSKTSKLYKVVQLLRRIFLFIYGIGGKVIFFAPLIGILCTIAHYHAATLLLTQDTLTTFNATSKLLEKIRQIIGVIQ